MRVGTHGVHLDFAPFFAPVPDEPSLIAASGIGSSGLTTGPYIGYLIAEYLNTGIWRRRPLSKPIDTYLSRL